MAPPKRRGMREMPVGGEPMGIEAAEKLSVGVPYGDLSVRMLSVCPLFPLHPTFRLFPALTTFLFRRQGHRSRAKPIAPLCIVFFPLVLLPVPVSSNSSSNILYFYHFYRPPPRSAQSQTRSRVVRFFSTFSLCVIAFINIDF